MKKLRMLIVEDDVGLIERLKALYQSVFSAQGYDCVLIEEARTVREARSLARSEKAQAYDLLSLDINLGDTELTGLDVLQSFNRFQSAWMVVLLTGVETDASVDTTMGQKKGDQLRTQLRKDAFERFPAERLIVVEKPSPTLPENEASTLLANRIGQIALTYEQVSRLRYIFKPIEVSSLERVKAPRGKKASRKFIETRSRHWQIRFNCGNIRTLPDKAGFATIHHLLQLKRDEALSPEQALVIEPKQEKAGAVLRPDGEIDPVSEYFTSLGVAWAELSEGEKTRMIQAALSHRFVRYVELRTFQDDDDLSADEEDELHRILSELGPLSSVAETGYLRLKGNGPRPPGSQEPTKAEIIQAGLHTGGSNYSKDNPRQFRVDSPEAKNFRARWKRAKDYLRENGYADLAQHLEDYIQSTGASWSYNPPEEIEWTT